MMGHGEVREWEGLQTLLGGVEIGWEKDEIRWRLPPFRVFTSRRMAKRIWKYNVPINIKIFLCQAFQNRIQAAQQLKIEWR
jgi:hypothetical protein